MPATMTRAATSERRRVCAATDRAGCSPERSAALLPVSRRGTRPRQPPPGSQRTRRPSWPSTSSRGRTAKGQCPRSLRTQDEPDLRTRVITEPLWLVTGYDRHPPSVRQPPGRAGRFVHRLWLRHFGGFGRAEHRVDPLEHLPHQHHDNHEPGHKKKTPELHVIAEHEVDCLQDQELAEEQDQPHG